MTQPTREEIDAAIVKFGSSYLGNHSMRLTHAGKPTKIASAFADAILALRSAATPDARAVVDAVGPLTERKCDCDVGMCTHRKDCRQLARDLAKDTPADGGGE